MGEIRFHRETVQVRGTVVSIPSGAADSESGRANLDDSGLVEEEGDAGVCQRVTKDFCALKKVVISFANECGSDALKTEKQLDACGQIVEVVIDEVASEGDEVGL